MNPEVQHLGLTVKNFPSKTYPITEEYNIGKNVLGLGISGKVVECFSIQTGQKFALKVCYYSQLYCKYIKLSNVICSLGTT